MQDYQDAGLRMVNLENFIQALKLSWIYKLFRDEQSVFIPVFEQSISSIDKLLKFDDILASPLWYNPMISSNTLFFQIGLKKGL